MREKKKYTILTFHTTTEAMAFEKQCMMNRIPGRLIPIPREITAGCGLSWRIGMDEYPLYKEKIQKLDLNFEKDYEVII